MDDRRRRRPAPRVAPGEPRAEADGFQGSAGRHDPGERHQPRHPVRPADNPRQHRPRKPTDAAARPRPDGAAAALNLLASFHLLASRPGDPRPAGRRSKYKRRLLILGPRGWKRKFQAIALGEAPPDRPCPTTHERFSHADALRVEVMCQRTVEVSGVPCPHRE